MIKKIATIMTNFLMNSGIKSEGERELYEYAIYSILLTISPLLLALFWGAVFGGIDRSLFIILPFAAIRKFSGGYHAKTETVCMLTSSLLLIGCMELTLYIPCGLSLIVFTGIAAISLICFSPIDNKNHLLHEEEKKSYRKITCFLTIFFYIAAIFCYFNAWIRHSICICIGIIYRKLPLHSQEIYGGKYMRCKSFKTEFKKIVAAVFGLMVLECSSNITNAATSDQVPLSVLVLGAGYINTQSGSLNVRESPSASAKIIASFCLRTV